MNTLHDIAILHFSGLFLHKVIIVDTVYETAMLMDSKHILRRHEDNSYNTFTCTFMMIKLK